jgi:hypothetical protein
LVRLNARAEEGRSEWLLPTKGRRSLLLREQRGENFPGEIERTGSHMAGDGEHIERTGRNIQAAIRAG